MKIHVGETAFLTAFRKDGCRHRKVDGLELYECETVVDGVIIAAFVNTASWKRWRIPQWRRWVG